MNQLWVHQQPIPGSTHNGIYVTEFPSDSLLAVAVLDWINGYGTGLEQEEIQFRATFLLIRLVGDGVVQRS